MSRRTGLAVLLPAVEQRGATRRIVNLSAFAREADLTLHEVVVTDLSTGGCRIAGAIDVAPGTRLWLKMPDLAPCSAHIAWSTPGEAGCTFDRPIDSDALAASTRRSTRELRRIFAPAWPEGANER